MGRVYYDKRFQKLVYDIRFPRPETWVTFDTILYKFTPKKPMSRSSMPSLARFSVFHLALTGQLPNYGLKGTAYSLKKSEVQDKALVSTWQPEARFATLLGKILTQQTQKLLSGVVIFDAKEQILQKQQFKNYQHFKGGLSFPSQITQVSYNEKREEFYKVSTFKNILVDEQGLDNLYNYVLVP